MPDDVTYKSWNDEEGRLFQKTIEKIRANIRSGLKFDLSCEFISIADAELKNIIIDNALKVEIAELHYGSGLTLADVSKRLGVSMERILKANHEMLEDVMNTAADVAGNHTDPPKTSFH